MTAVCIIPNCGRRAPDAEPFCSAHRDKKPARELAQIDPATECFFCGRTDQRPCDELCPRKSKAVTPPATRDCVREQVEDLIWRHVSGVHSFDSVGRYVGAISGAGEAAAAILTLVGLRVRELEGALEPFVTFASGLHMQGNPDALWGGVKLSDWDRALRAKAVKP